MTQQHEAELTLGDCHFCQSSALKIWGPDSRTGMSHVTCDNCGARGPLRGSAKMAAAEWAKAVSRHNKPKAPEGYALVPIGEVQSGLSVLSDIPALKEIIREHFYAAPFDGCTERLAVVLSRYIQGLPLRTPEEEEALRVSNLNAEERKRYWIDRNRTVMLAAPSITEPGEKV